MASWGSQQRRPSRPLEHQQAQRLRLEEQLAQALADNPKQWWIVKPPGRNNGSGIYLINNQSEIPQPDSEEEVMVQRYLPRC